MKKSSNENIDEISQHEDVVILQINHDEIHL